MKKYMVIGGIWLAVLMTIMICSSKTSLQYEIHFDSTKNISVKGKDARCIYRIGERCT